MRKNYSMSPRRNHPKRKNGARKTGDHEREINTSHETLEEHDDGIYLVRKITGSSSNKPYRCPGCDHMIPMATPHTVAWLEYDVETRRHWHNACWAKKSKRGPRTERTRNAPKY